MKVTLLSQTPNALALLLYTKNTRLQGRQTLDQIKAWPYDKQMEELAYMKDTIQSSWEFVDYTCEITGVTRAFTHQLVRTRQGSYAQESQRTVDVRDSNVINTSDVAPWMFEQAAKNAMLDYAHMIDHGTPVQDARGLLPTNIETSIIAKFDLRTLHNMALLRLCSRTQGEYQKVFKEMVRQVVNVHPWADQFLKVHCVWYGTCAFPRYDKCPIQHHTMFFDDGHKDLIEGAWNEMDHEANPFAKNGRSM